MTALQTTPGLPARGGRGGAASTGAVPPAAATRRSRRWRGQLTAWAFIAPVVIYLVLFYAYPLYRNIDLSLRAYTLRSFIDGTAPFVGLQNYLDVIQSSTFTPALINTAVFTGVSILFQFSIGMALAVFFFRNFRLAATLRALFLVPWLLPLLVSASVWAWMLNSESGVVNAVIEGLGLHQIKLITNNPRKIVGIEGYGLKVVERVPIEIPPRAANVRYLRTKKTKLGHILKKV